MKRIAVCYFFAGVYCMSSVQAQTWPDYHLTNGIHNTSYGIEIYDPLYPRNLYIDPGAFLNAGSTELDSIYDGNQVYLNGGTVYASAIDAGDFTWNSGRLYLNGGTHTSTYGLDSGTGKILDIDSSAVVAQTSPLSISSGNDLNLNYGGKLLVGDFDASTAGFNWNDGGTLEVRGILSSGTSGLSFMERQHLILQGPVASHIGALALERQSNVSILDGAILEATSLDTYYWHNGRIEVSGQDSEFRAGYLVLGEDGQRETELIVSDGGRVFSGGALLGDNGGSRNSASVSGMGSEWSMTGGISIGSAINGEDNHLYVTDGGVVNSASGRIGFADRGTEINSVEVKGNGSQWNMTGSLRIGYAGYGNSLVIEDGGVVSSASAIIGFDGDDYYSSYNSVLVSGEGSEWVNSGNLAISEYINDRGSYRRNSLTITNGGEVFIGGAVAINNTDESGNTLNLENGGRLTIGTDFDASMDGFNYNSGSTLAVQGQLSRLSTLEAGRRLEAAGVLGDMTVLGTFAPGNSPADSVLDGMLTIAADGSLEMELGGLLLGDEYDRLTVTDAAYLDGTLDIVLLDEFSLAYGDSFDLFNWDGGVTGEFASISTFALTGDLEWDTSELYTTGTLVVIPEPGVLGVMAMCGGGFVFIRRRFMI